MRRKNILKLAEFILTSPFDLDMGSIDVAKCGTAGCIAGHAAALWPSCALGGSYDAAAQAKKLGLSDEVWGSVVYPDVDSHKITRKRYAATKADAAALLMKLARTGKVDWSHVDEKE
jgi:hypothetical protein